jgi:hypothetical protein
MVRYKVSHTSIKTEKVDTDRSKTFKTDTPHERESIPEDKEDNDSYTEIQIEK